MAGPIGQGECRPASRLRETAVDLRRWRALYVTRTISCQTYRLRRFTFFLAFALCRDAA